MIVNERGDEMIINYQFEQLGLLHAKSERQAHFARSSVTK